MNKETEKILTDILAQAQKTEDASTIRREIKEYLINGVVHIGAQRKCLTCGCTWTAPVDFCPDDNCKNAYHPLTQSN